MGLNSKMFSPSVSELLREKNPSLHKDIMALLEKTSNSIDNITIPFDKMLSEPKNGSGRMAAEETVSNLIVIAEYIKKAGNDLNWNVNISE